VAALAAAETRSRNGNRAIAVSSGTVMKLIQTIFAPMAAATWLLSGVTADAADKYVGRCDVVFAGDSTLDSFSGDITNVPLRVLCGTNDSGKAVLNTRIEISPLQLNTHNKKRDANMYKMFRPESFPKLVMVVSNAPLDAAQLVTAGPGGSGPGVLPVEVTMCGITKEIRAATLNLEVVAEGLEFDLQTDLSLKEFKLEPPTILFGAISVRDIVKVKAHVKLQKEPP
jgi:hypothetical protein